MAIPSKEAPNSPVRHIDTDILRGMLDESENDDLWEVGRHLRNKTTKKNPLGVSLLAIGEAFHTLSEIPQKCEDGSCDAAARELRKLVQSGKLFLVGIGDPKNDALQIAQRLMKEDYRITPTDALILSVACSSPSCKELMTTDGVLLRSMKAREIAKDHDVRIKSPE